MNTMYENLVNELDSRDTFFELISELNMVAVDVEPNKWVTIEVLNNKYVGGYGYYSEYDNSYDFSNAGCPEFDSLDDAVDWLLNN